MPPGHSTLIVLQRRDFERFLVGAGQFPSPMEFRAVQNRPFQHERQRPTAHVPFNNFQRVEVYLNLLALIYRMKMRRWMVALEHANDDPVEAA